MSKNKIKRNLKKTYRVTVMGLFYGEGMGISTGEGRGLRLYGGVGFSTVYRFFFRVFALEDRDFSREGVRGERSPPFCHM